VEFLDNNQEDLSVCEYFLPSVVSNLISENIAKTKMLSTTSKWFGMTYKGDLEVVQNKIIQMKENGEYPDNLWG
jgi:hypothetical protein